MSNNVLTNLRADRACWTELVSFNPETPGQADTDKNLRNRYLALLDLHRHHHPVLKKGEDEELIAYLQDQEILYHLSADHYRSSISLASYLLARYRNPKNLWAIWVAKESNYDASKGVDPHMLYYTVGSIALAKEYVEASSVGDVIAGAEEGSGRRTWWNSLREETADEALAFQEIKTNILQRFDQDSKRLTDEKVEAFFASYVRTDVAEWEGSLLDD